MSNTDNEDFYAVRNPLYRFSNPLDLEDFQEKLPELMQRVPEEFRASTYLEAEINQVADDIVVEEDDDPEYETVITFGYYSPEK